MANTNIDIPTDLRDYADKQRAITHEGLAAYIRRLIVEDKARKEAGAS